MSTAVTDTDPICLVQLTDSHLYAGADQALLGMDTYASLQAVIDQVLVEQPRIDHVLATGDITQDGSLGAYERFIEASRRLPVPCSWIAGNHDDAELMAELGQAHGLNQTCLDLGNWRIVMLDSSIPGAVPGHLADTQLALLEQALSEVGERHVMVCLHHHPVPIGCDWMEPIGLLNPEPFWQLVDACAQVRAVLWGHVHQSFDQQRRGVRLLATPSTCVQFAVASQDFATDTLAPGYRWLRLYPDGRIETAVERLAPGRFLPDPGATGY